MSVKLRFFGTEMSGNHQKNAELTPEHRAAICAAIESGLPQQTVAEQYGVSRGAVRRTIERCKTNKTLASVIRIGRPKKLNCRERRYVLQVVRRRPKIAYKALVQAVGSEVSVRTV
jgi:transposase